MKEINLIEDWLSSAYTVAIVGNKGSGKTVLLEHLAMKFYERGDDVVYIDAVGASFEHAKSGTLDDTLFNWINIDISKIDEDVLKKYIARLIKVDSINAFNLMYLTQKEKVDVADKLFRILQKIKNYVLIIDEIQELTPQLRGHYSQETERIIRVGRNFGIKPVIFSSQRPQTVSKQVLALSDVFIIKKIDYYRDANVLGEIVGVSGKNNLVKFRRQLKNLKVNESYIVSSNSAEKVFFDLETKKFYLPVARRPVSWFMLPEERE